VVVAASMVVVVSVVEVSTAALWLPDTLEAESAAAAVESALADRTSQVGFRILPAQVLGSLHLGDRHPGNQSMKDDLIDP
jgi:hypothetical protein